MGARSAPHRRYLTVGALAVGSVPFVPPMIQGVVGLTLALSAIGAIWYGLHRYRPPRAFPWLLLSGCVVLGLLGDLASTAGWYVAGSDASGRPAFPDPAEIAYALTMPLLMVAMVGWTRRRLGPAGIVEGGVAAAGGATVIWTTVAAPMLNSGHVGGARLIGYLCFLGLDLALTVLVVRLVLSSRSRTVSCSLLAVGSVLMIATDLTFHALYARGVDPTTVVVTGYLISYVLLGTAALHPSMARCGGVEEMTEPDPASRRRQLGYVALIVLSCGLNVVQLVGDGRAETRWYHVVMPIVLNGVMAVLLVVRLSQLATTIKRRSRIDTLTGLGNLSQLRQDIATFDPAGSPGSALLLVDLDGFRDINDSYGHRTGDTILRAVAGRLELLADTYETAPVRLSGDEFAILLRSGSARAARDLADAVVDAVSEPYHLPGGGTALLTASVGMRPLASRGTAEEALREADLALLTSQGNGGNQVAVYDATQHLARQARTQLVRDLNRAVAGAEFTVAYQPIVNLTTGTIVAAEALLRWPQPDGSFVPPDRFVPVAEQSGAIVPIGDWVIHTVCAQQRDWYHRFGVPVTVNVSARQLRHPGFAASVLAALDTNDLPGGALIVEITETGLITTINDAATVTEHLHTLRRHGVQIAIDDFGTGYSSLAYLRQLPVDILKMDGSFTANQVHSGSARDLVFIRAIVELATSLDLRTVAEAVETPEQAHRLAALGCQLAQGYHYARPAPAASVEELFAAQDRPASPPWRPGQNPAAGYRPAGEAVPAG